MARSSTLPIPVSAGTNRTYHQFLKSAGKDALVYERNARERRSAIAEFMEDWLEQCEPAQLIEFFVAVESAATSAKRRKIETHPMRPKAVTERVKAELARREAVRAQEEREAQATAAAAKEVKGTAGLGDTAGSL